MTGELPGGTQLPSIRALARDLQVSIITTKRAYEELEREGILISAAARGTFVADHPPESIRRIHLDEVRSALKKAAGSAKSAGISEAEFLELSGQLFREEL